MHAALHRPQDNVGNFQQRRSTMLLFDCARRHTTGSITVRNLLLRNYKSG